MKISNKQSLSVNKRHLFYMRVNVRAQSLREQQAQPCSNHTRFTGIPSELVLPFPGGSLKRASATYMRASEASP